MSDTDSTFLLLLSCFCHCKACSDKARSIFFLPVLNVFVELQFLGRCIYWVRPEWVWLKEIIDIWQTSELKMKAWVKINKEWWTQCQHGPTERRAAAVWTRASALLDLRALILRNFSLQNVHILPQTVLYMADSETFISLEECRGHKRGEYQKPKVWGFCLLMCLLFGVDCVLSWGWLWAYPWGHMNWLSFSREELFLPQRLVSEPCSAIERNSLESCLAYFEIL